jgi:hypothetical protein
MRPINGRQSEVSIVKPPVNVANGAPKRLDKIRHITRTSFRISKLARSVCAFVGKFHEDRVSNIRIVA